jgi:hypothetical protein
VSHGQQHLSAHPAAIDDYALSFFRRIVFLYLIYVSFLGRNVRFFFTVPLESRL